jgi:hypothetical protein
MSFTQWPGSRGRRGYQHGRGARGYQGLHDYRFYGQDGLVDNQWRDRVGGMSPQRQAFGYLGGWQGPAGGNWYNGARNGFMGMQHQQSPYRRQPWGAGRYFG